MAKNGDSHVIFPVPLPEKCPLRDHAHFGTIELSGSPEQIAKCTVDMEFFSKQLVEVTTAMKTGLYGKSTVSYLHYSYLISFPIIKDLTKANLLTPHVHLRSAFSAQINSVSQQVNEETPVVEGDEHDEMRVLTEQKMELERLLKTKQMTYGCTYKAVCQRDSGF